MSATLAAASTEYGRHSLIPACCIVAYVADEQAGIHEIGAWRDRQFGFTLWTSPAGEYVPCPECYAQIVRGEITAIAIHHCDVERDAECQRVRTAYEAAISSYSRAALATVQP